MFGQTKRYDISVSQYTCGQELVFTESCNTVFTGQSQIQALSHYGEQYIHQFTSIDACINSRDDGARQRVPYLTSFSNMTHTSRMTLEFKRAITTNTGKEKLDTFQRFAACSDHCPLAFNVIIFVCMYYAYPIHSPSLSLESYEGHHNHDVGEALSF